MNFELTDEQNMIRETVRDFAEREIKPVAQELDEKAEFSYDLTRKMGELGLFGMYLPEQYGGQVLDTLSYIIAVEELARIDGSQAATLAAHNSLGIGPLYYYGTEEQKMKYLPQLCTGESLWGFGLTEPNAGSDSRGTKTTANLKNGEWTINGSKIFITNGACKISIGSTVQAVTKTFENGEKEFTTIIVEKGTSGFKQVSMHGKMMWRASDTAELYFDDCKVPEENLLGKIGEGSHIMLSTLDNGRLSIAAMGLGCAQGAFELALEHAGKRKIFDQTITDFQAKTFEAADFYAKIEAARLMLWKACWKIDQNKNFRQESSLAKYLAVEIARNVTAWAADIFGAASVIQEHPIHKFPMDAWASSLGEGTQDVQKLVIFRGLMKQYN